MDTDFFLISIYLDIFLQFLESCLFLSHNDNNTAVTEDLKIIYVNEVCEMFILRKR